MLYTFQAQTMVAALSFFFSPSLLFSLKIEETLVLDP